MPIDDHPIRAAQVRLASEDLFRENLAQWVVSLAARMPQIPAQFKAILQAFASRRAADDLSRTKYLLDVVAEAVCDQDARVAALEIELRNFSPEAKQEREDGVAELLADAARKAEATRALERIRRIGAIFVAGVTERAILAPDEVEELMRVAMNLSDSEVRYLAELVRIEGSLLDNHDHIDRYNAHQRWEQGSWGGQVDPDLTSAFNKLESYGLVSRVAPPNNLNIHADFQNRYVLLPKGQRFVTLARIQVGQRL